MSSTFSVDPNRDPDDHLSEIRQSVVDGLHKALTSAEFGEFFPQILLEALENRIWAHPRKLAYKIAKPMTLLEFVTTSYPHGLGTTVEIVKKFIARDAKAMSEWEKALEEEKKAAPNPTGTNQYTKPADREKEVNVDIINTNQKLPGRPDGTSAQYGLRRLRHAAEAGDEKAADMLCRVLDPNDPTTVNGAAVIMGWRKPMINIVDNPESIARVAMVKNGGVVNMWQRLWTKATQEEREEIAAWVDQQMSPLLRSRIL